MNNISHIYVGIDISKNTLDIHFYPLDKRFKVANSQEGINILLQEFSQYQVNQIMCEPSGGYEHLILKMMSSKYKVWLVGPDRVRAFIKSEGIKAKTDKIDARMLALFGSKKSIKKHYSHRSVVEEKLSALNRRRSDIVDMITKESNRLENPYQLICNKSISKHIVFMQKQVLEIEAEIDHLISNDSLLTNKKRIIESVPGVGKISALALIAHMPELGTIDGKKIAALLGVAPFIKQSGLSKGTAVINGGRSLIRKIIYMAAVSAIRCNPVLKAFYKKLRQAGKKPKVALVAVMRKLIVTLNALVKKHEDWSLNKIAY